MTNLPSELPEDRFARMLTFAESVCLSSLCPKAYAGKPADAAVAMVMGHAVGLNPLSSLQSIAVINGNPSLWGDGALGVVQASGLLERFEERDPAESLAKGEAECVFVRKGNASPIRRTFTKAQAQQAGLWGKAGPWQNYPGRMLQMRARALALRDGFADVLKGMGIAEEVQDYPTQPAAVEMMPRSKSGEGIPSPQASLLSSGQSSAKPAEIVAPEPSQAAGDAPWLVYPIQVQAKTSKTGKSFWIVTLDDRDEGKVTDASTFSSTVSGAAEALLSQPCYAKIERKNVNGKDFVNLVAIEPAPVQEPGEPA